MKYIISRTSEWDDKKPCKGCKLVETDTISGRGKEWVKELDDLVKFQKEIGEPIIIKESYSKEYPIELEIYDHYRE